MSGLQQSLEVATAWEPKTYYCSEERACGSWLEKDCFVSASRALECSADRFAEQASRPSSGGVR